MDDDNIPQLLENTSSDPYDRRKVPITLLTGYLGAGKSTLLNYILTGDHGYRIAVCMNDFGDTTDIESKSMTLSANPASGSTQEDPASSFLSLPNGCLCCSVKDLGIAAIEDMVANAPGGVDWVVVELTGVADPAPIVRTFWANEEMGDLILDGVICVVDSRNVLKQLAEEKSSGEINECQKQVACADVILLNKLDLVDKAQLQEVEATIRELNPTLRVHHTTNSRAPLGEMFNLRAFSDAAGSGSAILRELADPAPESHVHSEACDHEHDQHHSKITTALIPLPPLSTEQYTLLNGFLESLLWNGLYPSANSDDRKEAPEILRTKGYITLHDGTAFVLQGVVDLFEVKEVKENGEGKGETVAGKIVFIGRGVGEEVKRALVEWVGL
ncbi:hypothetical protein L202_02158 [Cryptococcus amylolentus CBS 6039]|uniref:CobW/HypB/UreG nucleotide-binding domain-containing protein n=2 Tax=Cryptococcus amylolentus TaxID=104669 RepID=A0A1E3I1E6_9TREE|nr:hypothetical protein L202_02158 [Cryptococcus amylolentus CBS 6039]ODN81786.1 hypothetical protein L202_02158 [Cryptococcus amylolentus CBS 6039]ODO10034.1 hypothetical protein I350_02259 [Cryptococcus amylolentus CBS 6273]